MRILFVQRHFAPDANAPAQTLSAICRRLSDEGHEVSVLTARQSGTRADQGGYLRRKESLDGAAVRRVWIPQEGKRGLIGRLTEALFFSVKAFAHILGRAGRYDLVVVSSYPPVLLPAGVRYATALRRRPYVYSVLDLNPEGAVYGGAVADAWWTTVLARLDFKNCERAAAVVVLSGDMVKGLQDRGLVAANAVIINNFVTFRIEIGAVPEDLRKAPGVFRVLFAGNIGLVQALEGVVEAAKLLANEETIEFMFVGRGAGEAGLREQAAELIGGTVRFVDYQPQAVANGLMADADLGVVSLAPGMYRVAYPSKTMAYLEAGCPVLAVLEEDSELVQMIQRHGVGAWAPPGDPRAMADAILGARHLDLDRSTLQRVSEEYFGQTIQLARWSRLFADLEAGGAV